MVALDDELLGAFSSGRVMEDGEPVLLVFHEEGGDRQFLSSYEERTDEIRYLHLSHLLERDPSLGALADLPAGWKARRERPGGDWVREVTPPDQPEVSPS